MLNQHENNPSLRRGIISEEEQELASKSAVAGGESKLSKDDFIRLISLRYVRNGLSQDTATELATLEQKAMGVNGEYKLSSEDFIRIISMRYIIDGMAQDEAVELATLQRECGENGENFVNLAPEKKQRITDIRNKYSEIKKNIGKL